MSQVERLANARQERMKQQNKDVYMQGNQQPQFNQDEVPFRNDIVHEQYKGMFMDSIQLVQKNRNNIEEMMRYRNPQDGKYYIISEREYDRAKAPKGYPHKIEFLMRFSENFEFEAQSSVKVQPFTKHLLEM